MINRTWLHKIEREAGQQDRATIQQAIHTLEYLLAGWEEEPEIKSNKNREVVKQEKRGGMTYQFERVKCGKAACKKCQSGPAHGPYWYGYWKEGGKTKSKYIGKKLADPAE